MARVLTKSSRKAVPPPPRAKWISQQFDFPTSLVGQSVWQGSDGVPVSVYYDPSLGQAGLACARFVLGKIDDLMSYCDAVFGVRGQGGNVIIAAISGATDGTAGAYHYGCFFGSQGGDWYVDFDAADYLLTLGLVMAEVCESYMGLQGRGWGCGNSGGEGLSRVLAEIVSNGSSGSLATYSSGASWDGSDWISRDQGTDQDYPSIGCSVLYLWWMLSQGYTVQQIVQAGEPDGTLASNYAVLTGKSASQAFPDFQAAVEKVGGPGGFRGDNPWNVPNPPYPLSTPAPVPPPPVPPPPNPTPTPVPPGPAPVPIAVIKAKIDAIFAEAIKLAGWSKLLRQILKAVQDKVDTVLSSYQMRANPPIPPVVIDVINAAFLLAEKEYPQYAAELRIVRDLIAQFLPLV